MIALSPVRRVVGAALALLALALAWPCALTAQTPATELAEQTLGRGYLHMFLAYAVAWALVLGWVVSIARRLARVERTLDREA